VEVRLGMRGKMEERDDATEVGEVSGRTLEIALEKAEVTAVV